MVEPDTQRHHTDRIVQYTSSPKYDDDRHANKWLRLRVASLADGYTSRELTPIDMWDRLIETMEYSGGIGLSANQIGLSVRAFVMKTNTRLVRVQDPKIIEVSTTENAVYEGCLSLGDGALPAKGPISRPECILVEYSKGSERVRESLIGIEARIFQHEYDHLNGFLFTDHDIIGPNLRRQMLLHQGCFEPSRVDWEPSETGIKSITIEEHPEAHQVKYQAEYNDQATYHFHKADGDFRTRLVHLIQTNLYSSIEAW